MKKSEAEFVNEGFSPEELTAIENNTGEPPAPAPEPQSVPVVVEPAPGTEGVTAAPVVEGDAGKPQMVDVRAVQEARAAARASQEELARFKSEQVATQVRLDERLKLLNDALTNQNKPEEPKIPTEDEDPFGHLQHELKATKAEIAAMKEDRAKEAEYNKSMGERQAIIQKADVVIEQAKAKHPDFDEAMNFAVQGVKTEIARRLTAQGVVGEQFAQVGNQMFEATILRYASEMDGMNADDAAEHIRRHARFWGWTPQQVQQAAQPGVQIPQVQQPAPAIVQPTIQQRAEQQDRHMSLSGVQGGTAPIQLDAKGLAAMSDEDYRALLSTVSGKKQVREIMGGV